MNDSESESKDLISETIPTAQSVLKSNNNGAIKIPSHKRRSDF